MARCWFIAIDALILYLICCMCNDSLIFAKSSPIVHIKNGTLEGTIMKSRKGREILAFRGIPFAQPPLGKLRFEPPEPFDSWTGVRSAKEDSNICVQRDALIHQEEILGVEDCLYLNVYTPKLPSDGIAASQTIYPVMIWIHGGAFYAGAGTSHFYGPKYLLDHDIVFVAANYRLGPLGFLSTEDMVSPGNQGLKDQVQAMKWVQENIAAFGGDPNRVTIGGESAGAASVHHQMISPLSRGLFHRAISISGTALCPWAISPRPGHAKSQAERLGQLLDCPTDQSTKLVECLRKKDAVDIIATDHNFQIFGYCPVIPFRPVIEPDHPGAFIKEHPAESLKSGNIADLPWITGTTAHEGAIKSAAIFGHKEKGLDKLFDEKFMELAPISLLYEHTCPNELQEDVTKRIRKFYLGDKKIDISAKWNITDMYTDVFFFIATANAVQHHLEGLSSPVYYYFFTHQGSLSVTELFGKTEDNYGVCHGDDSIYIFPTHEHQFVNKSFSKEDYKMVDMMTTLFVNFAKSGNPTPEKTTQIPIKWKPVRTSNLEYLQIANSTNLSMGSNLFPERVKFWANIPYRGKMEPRKDEQRDKDEL